MAVNPRENPIQITPQVSFQKNIFYFAQSESSDAGYRCVIFLSSVRTWSVLIHKIKWLCLSRIFLPFIPTHLKETHMSDPVVDKIQSHPKYLELRKKRGGFGWLLTLLMMVVYYGYIALIAFNKPFLAQRMGEGVMTVGVPLGMGVIIFTIVITAIYVRRANSEYDDLTAAILKDVSK
jgi:uncharacterized membrane protein (DUF485 family)